MNYLSRKISSVVLNEGVHYLENPEENIPKILNWVEKLAKNEKHKKAVRYFKEMTVDPDNNISRFIKRVLEELHPKVRTKFFINYIVQEGLFGWSHIESMKEKHHCNIPWAILMDPTSACNLKCTGCWALEYAKTDNLDYETLDRIINEGKELGIYFYLYSGGEPLLRKMDLIRLAEKHNDCLFLAFTNAALVDEALCQEMARVGNLLLAISVEGFEKETDMRRGKGTFKKIMQAMNLLKEHSLGFGFSTCYHSKNTEVVGSDEYIDLMMEKGCLFGWYFTYMPLGKNAVVDLIATAEQREHMYHRVREIRNKEPIFVLDFWNDGEYLEGCIAGGRYYLHINACGDVEPCAFIHYSNINIKDTTLIEALKSPIFRQYNESQPFNLNHLRPCPLLDNPEELKRMVHETQAFSTQTLDHEDVEVLTERCLKPSQKWAQRAERLWRESGKEDYAGVNEASK